MRKISQSFWRSFILFFITMTLFFAVNMSFYIKGEIATLQQEIFLQMRAFSLHLQGDAFTTDIIEPIADKERFRLYETDGGLEAYFPVLDLDNAWLKIALTPADYQVKLEALSRNFSYVIIAFVIIVGLLSLLFAWYTLQPLRESYRLLEHFLKDIIHDLNTPVAAIKLNAMMLKQKMSLERIERIELASQTITGLYQNLESFLRNQKEEPKAVDLKALLEQRVDYFSSVYANLTFKTRLEEVTLTTEEFSFMRIVDNILSNACKYNSSDGEVRIQLDKGSLRIEDDGIGIKDPKRVFERYYNEGERGLGLGLHVVASLAKRLALRIEVEGLEKGTAFIIRW